MADWANVSAPPVGPVDSIADLLATLQLTKAKQNSEARRLADRLWL